MPFTPNSSLEPSFAAECALQLARIMLLSNMRSHEPEVVRNGLRTWIIIWSSQGSSQTLTGFSLTLTFQPRLQTSWQILPQDAWPQGLQMLISIQGKLFQLGRDALKQRWNGTRPSRKKKKPKKGASKTKVLNALQSSKTKWPSMMPAPRELIHETEKVRLSDLIFCVT